MHLLNDHHHQHKRRLSHHHNHRTTKSNSSAITTLKQQQQQQHHHLETQKSLENFTNIDIHGLKVYVNHLPTASTLKNSTSSASHKSSSPSPPPAIVTYSNRETSFGRSELSIDLSKINKSSKFSNTDLSNFHNLLRSSLKGEVRKKKRPVRLLPVVSVEIELMTTSTTATTSARSSKKREELETPAIPEREPAAKRQTLVESFKRKSISLPVASSSIGSSGQAGKRKSIILQELGKGSSSCANANATTTANSTSPIPSSEWHLHLPEEMPDTARMQQLFSWSLQRLLEAEETEEKAEKSSSSTANQQRLGEKGKAACRALLEKIHSREVNTSWYANRKQRDPFQHRISQLSWTIQQRINSIKPVLSMEESQIIKQNMEIAHSLGEIRENSILEAEKKAVKIKELAYDLRILEKFEEESEEFVQILQKAVNSAFSQPVSVVSPGELIELFRTFSGKSYSSLNLIQSGNCLSAEKQPQQSLLC